MTPNTLSESIKPGLYHDLSFESYLHIPAVSQTVLKHMDQSPAHCRHFMDTPMTLSPAMEFGTLVHAGKLEPEQLMERYLVMPDFANDPRNCKTDGSMPSSPTATSWYKQRVERFKVEAERTGKAIISEIDFARMMAMLRRMEDHRVVKMAFDRQGGHETVQIWECPYTGLLCKARCDALLTDTKLPTILDLKTTRDASEDGFVRSILKFKYHLQAAWYVDGYRVIAGKDANFVICAIESEPPHGLQLFELDDEWIRLGRNEYLPLVRQFHQCWATDSWPQYTPEIKVPVIPEWSRKKGAA
jgi:hypothetical protein